MGRLTVKSSTIFIAVGGTTRIYRSVEEVPAPLRRKLEQSTNSLNSATILIADRGGREEIAKAIHGLPSHVRSRLASCLMPSEKTEDAKPRRFAFVIRNWAEILLPAAVGLLIWLAFNLK